MINAPTATPNGTNTAHDQEPANGQSQQPAEDSGAGQQGSSLEEQLAEARRQGAEEERRKFEPQYRGLQRTHEQLRQRNAQLENDRKLLSGLPAMQRVVTTLAGRILGPDELQKLALEVENDSLKAQNSLPAPAPAPEPDVERNPSDERQKILRHWGGSRTPIKVDDPRLDWATDEPHTQEGAQRARDRFVDSLREAERQEAEKRVRDDARSRQRTAQLEAGAERTDGSEPNGPVSGTRAVVSSNPVDWNSRSLLTEGFQQIDSEAARRSQRKSMRQEQDVIAARDEPRAPRREERR